MGKRTCLVQLQVPERSHLLTNYGTSSDLWGPALWSVAKMGMDFCHPYFTMTSLRIAWDPWKWHPLGKVQNKDRAIVGPGETGDHCGAVVAEVLLQTIKM